MTITPEEIARLRALEAKATPGPWTHDADDLPAERTNCAEVWVEYADESYEQVIGFDESISPHNARLVVESRNALPSLLDEIERLRAENDRLRVLTTCVCHMLKRDELRADLREAVALLAQAAPPCTMGHGRQRWDDRRDALLAKHKEMP